MKLGRSRLQPIASQAILYDANKNVRSGFATASDSRPPWEVFFCKEFLGGVRDRLALRQSLLSVRADMKLWHNPQNATSPRGSIAAAVAGTLAISAKVAGAGVS